MKNILLIFALTSSVAAAQEIRMGALEGHDLQFVAAPATLIDWSRPATANGTVNTASVAWRNATTPCNDIFFIRFYSIPNNGFAAVMTAERGPFRGLNGINTVALDPPVAVTTETYIGIRRNAGPDSCGQPYGTFTRIPGRAIYTADDYKGGTFTNLTNMPSFRLQAVASNVPTIRVSTLPVVGAAPGAFGSFFRTSLFLTNPGTTDAYGKLVFHPAGQAGSDSDPSLAFFIPGNGTAAYPDIIATMNQTGLGSLDIYTTASTTPVVTARVFNDDGAKGTTGLVEEAVPVDAQPLVQSTVLIPADLTNFRLNVGVRTFGAGIVTVLIFDAAGTGAGGFNKVYPANFFEQVPAQTFIGDRFLPPGGKIVITSTQLNFIAYGSTTDNRTNDPAMRIGAD